MSGRLLIYGATGYTAGLIIERLLERGVRPILGGRNAAKLRSLASALDLEQRIAELTNAATLDAILADVAVVLHTAGPFSQTARLMLEACLRTATHYIDITAEVGVIEALAQCDAD